MLRVPGSNVRRQWSQRKCLLNGDRPEKEKNIKATSFIWLTCKEALQGPFQENHGLFGLPQCWWGTGNLRGKGETEVMPFAVGGSGHCTQTTASTQIPDLNHSASLLLLLMAFKNSTRFYFYHRKCFWEYSLSVRQENKRPTLDKIKCWVPLVSLLLRGSGGGGEEGQGSSHSPQHSPQADGFIEFSVW